MSADDKHQLNINRKLGRMDTTYIHYGEFSVLVKPDRESDVPATILLSIKGPGLPTLAVDKSGVTIEDPENFGCAEGLGQISFTEKLCIPMQSKNRGSSE